MRILIMGNEGSTGRRYESIIKMLGGEVEGYDLIHFRNNRKVSHGDMAIIATPTHLHATHCKLLLEAGYTKILVEKPFSKHIHNIQNIIGIMGDADIRVICNWKFASFIDLKSGDNHIEYNFYNCGADEQPIFDLCQLVYLQDGFDFDFGYDSPFFTCSINGFNISLRDIERSYYKMLVRWIVKPEDLWSIHDALAMTEKVLEYLNP